MILFSDVRSGPVAVRELRIPQGVIAVTGPNGAGKTILLELIAGIRLPESGTITIGGKKPRETSVGWVGSFPDLNMIFSRTRDEIASSLRFRHIPPEETTIRVETIAAELGINHLLEQPVRYLSGGEKILVAIAAALVSRPDIIIFDETDAHLDIDTILGVDRIVRNLQPSWLIYASHREDHIAFADLVIELGTGFVTEEVHASVFHPERGPLSNPDLWRRVHATRS